MASKKMKAADGSPNAVMVGMAPYKPPTDAQRVKEHARNAKVRATQDWIDGRMDTEQHENVHKRANHVLEKKRPTGYRGKTGERKPKAGMIW